MKSQPTDWEKIFANDVTDKGLSLKTYKQLMWLNIRQPTVQSKNEKTLGLSWWLGGKESACQCRRLEFDPWSGKIPQALEKLSLYATATKPVL